MAKMAKGKQPDPLEALEQVIRWTAELSPRPTHPGACGPESGCDSECMEAAYCAEAISAARDALEKVRKLIQFLSDSLEIEAFPAINNRAYVYDADRMDKLLAPFRTEGQ